MKNTEKNLYPKAILSDCRIDNLKIEKTDIHISFKKDGFLLKNDSNNLYYHTDCSEIIIENADIENITVELKKK